VTAELDEHHDDDDDAFNHTDADEHQPCSSFTRAPQTLEA
jgi:hypothetical protein